ncbi:PAS domain S-box protein [Paraflavisolibacter sp. H34]|uniref:sensor histidine kinase n=1 Tax=Huijunlia imazamoxiresistens TaxID=3127457 RepID=UPI0030161D5A
MNVPHNLSLSQQEKAVLSGPLVHGHALLTLGADGRILEADQPLCGHGKADLEKANFLHLVHPDDKPVLRELLQQAAEGQRAKNILHRFSLRNGSWHWLNTSFVPGIPGQVTAIASEAAHLAAPAGAPRMGSNNVTGLVENGCLLRVWSSKRDVTQQKINEESIQYMASIVDNATDAIYSFTPDGKVCSWNKACQELTGIAPRDILGHPVRSLLQYRYKSASLREINTTLRRNGSWKGEIEVENGRHGRPLFLLVTIISLRDGSNNFTRFLVFCKDLSENKKAENLLKESEERFRNMADATPAMIYVVNEKEWPVYFNRKWLEFTGRTLEEEIASNVDDNIHPDDVVRVKQIYYSNTLARKPFDVEYRLRTGDGSFRWIIDRATPRYLEDGTYVGYIGIGYDIQDRKEADEQRLKQAEYMGNLLRSITDGFLAMDNNFIVTMWNTAAEELFRIKAEDAVGRPAHTHFKAYKNTRGAALLNTALQNRQTTRFEEYISETDKWVEAHVFPFADGFFVYCRDTTERKRREMQLELQTKALKVSNDRYEFLKAATNEIIWGIDLKTGRVDLSAGWKRLFGYELPETGIGPSFLYDKAHPEDREKACRFFSGIPKNKMNHLAEYRLQKADGSYVFVQATACLITGAGNEPLRLIGSIKDITKQKELEQQLVLEEIDKQQRIKEAILEGSERQRSEISRELHDNVNQILSSAKLYLELAQKRDEIEPLLVTKSIDFIMMGINEIRRLSHTLAPPGLRQLGLQDAIEEHLRNLSLLQQIKISFSFTRSIDKLASEEMKLSLYRIVQEQLNNIIKYARASRVSIKVAREQNDLVLSIRDNGVGFTFATVKKGLGLANIANRAALFKGTATIDSSPHKGCKIVVRIPLKS